MISAPFSIHRLFALTAAASAVSAPALQADLSDLVASAEAVQVAGGFAFTEGPARDAEGNVYFSDIPNNRIHVFTVKGRLETPREDSGGANGLRFDAEGRLVACEGGSRRLTRQAADGAISTLAEQFEGKRLNSPNDLWIDPSGGIYFTDPRYGDTANQEIDGYHVYYLAPDQSLRRAADDFVKPNGIVGTPDGKTLYIADAGDGKIYRYRIGEAGTLEDKTLFVEQGSDGMILDEKGNLYITTDAVHIYSPDGAHLGSIRTAERPANVAFGGADGRTLFITARTSLYAIRMQVTGQ